MPTTVELDALIARGREYLEESLLPFWMDRSPDPDFGGFLTYFDREGNATGETDKPFLGQIRLLFTFSSAYRAGYGGERAKELAEWAADFLLEHYWDDEQDGWYWICDRSGKPINTSKVGYGHCFGIYAFSEYYLATRDTRGRDAAVRTYQAVCEHMADTRYGGWIELMNRDWTPAAPGIYGGDRKSMDVHMHMMEALTRFLEMTRHPTHRRRLLESIDLLLDHMIRPVTGTGYIQFDYAFNPLPAIIFATEWGRDKHPDDGNAHPLDFTSYGHNVEFAWLLLHAAEILGVDKHEYDEVVRRISDHCLTYGIDTTFGGVYCEGPDQAPTRNHEKQFWQQGEVMVGMLDAYLLLGDSRYWNGFRNVWDFLFEYFVTPEAGGEWLERVARDGTVVDDAIAHAWKINYHSVRSIIQVVDRLQKIRELHASGSR